MLKSMRFAEFDADSTGSLETQESARYRRGQIWCKFCKRWDYHFLTIQPAWWRVLLRIVTLGGITLVGVYRCRCCGTRRIGGVDIIRGPDRPARESSSPSRRSSETEWRHAVRRSRRKSMLGKLNPFTWISQGTDSWAFVKLRSRVKRWFSSLFRKRRSRRSRRSSRYRSR